GRARDQRPVRLRGASRRRRSAARRPPADRAPARRRAALRDRPCLGADRARARARARVPTMIDVEEARAEHAARLAAPFGAAASPGSCRFWHFSGTNNAWLLRCATEPNENRAELVAALEAGSDEARGVVALAGTSVVGWLKVAPARAMKKAYDRRLYRGLP